MPATKIKAQIRGDQPAAYQPTHPPGYFYMFTGGYRLAKGKFEKVGEDDGPAGEVPIDDKNGSFEIKLKDHTGEQFRIVRWHMEESNIPGASYDPAPDTDLPPTRKLTISASEIPEGHYMAYDVYTVTVEGEKGQRFKLDPRIYDVRQ